MAYIMAGGLFGLVMAASVLATGGGILLALLAYSLGGCATALLLACAAVAVRPGKPLLPPRLEGPGKHPA